MHVKGLVAIIATAVAVSPAAALAQTPGGPTRPPAPPPIGNPAPPPAPPTIGIPAPPPPPPAPAFPAPNNAKAGPPPANPTKMAAEIRKLMTNNGFGWQFAIAQNGKFVPGNDTTDKRSGGFARSDADNPNGGSIAMKPTMRYELASVTKNVTAVATMKLLRAQNKGLTVDSRVGPYLPGAWKRGKGWDTMTFRNLLAHNSGILQMLVAQQAKLGETQFKKVFNNNWDGLRWTVAQNVTPGSGAVYKNANYGLLGIANAYLWKAVGGQVMGTKATYVESMNYKGDEIKKKVYVPVVLDVGENTHARYQEQFNQRRIFTPAGINNVGCVGDPATSGLNYAAGADKDSKGKLMAWHHLICAGNAGLRLSAIELVRYLAHLRHGNIIDPADLKTMDDGRLGWNYASNGTFGHGGALNPDNAPQTWTCAITFADGTEAAIIVNSPTVTTDRCDVLKLAWAAAK